MDRRPPKGGLQNPAGHVTEMVGHVPEFGGHDAETVGHDGPKCAHTEARPFRHRSDSASVVTAAPKADGGADQRLGERITMD